MPHKTDIHAYALRRIDLFTHVGDETVPVTATVRQPFERIDESWLCAVSISGLFHRKTDIERTTAEQSVRDAQKFVFEELSGYIAGGGELFDAKGRPVSDLKAIVFQKNR